MTTEIAELLAKATPRPWSVFNMVHAERGDPMTPDEIGEYVSGCVRQSKEYGGSDDFLFVSEATAAGPDLCHVGNGPRGPWNAALIVHAVNNIERLTSENEALREALAPFADAGELLDLETDGFLGGEKVSLFHEDFELFDGLKFGDFLRAAKAFAALSKKGEGE